MKPLHNISLLIILLKLFSLCSARDTLTQSEPLADNETLVSSGGRFTLGFFTPAGTSNRYFGLWYSNITDPTILWVANREDPVINSTGTLSISAGGRLAITGKNSRLIWSTENTALNNTVAQLLDTGNFVVKVEGNDSDSYAWQGFDYPTDTLIPSMKLGLDRKAGLNHTLTAWKSNNDPSPGEHYLSMDINGDPQIFLCTRSNKISRSWADSQGSVDPTIYNGFTSQFVNNKEEMTYSYLATNQSVLSRIVVNQSGILQLSLWLVGGSNQWIVAWYSPKDPCDNYAECGPYGVCDPNTTPLCSCLPGFSPKNPTKWKLGDGSDGCVRDKTLDCKNIETNGFVAVSHVRLPASSNGTVNMSLSHDDECIAACLKNCSCTAYAIANVSGSGGGCLIWVSELLDVRLDDNDGGLDLYVRHAGNGTFFFSSVDHSCIIQPFEKNLGGKKYFCTLLLGTLILIVGYYR